MPQDDILHQQLGVGRALEFAAELRFPGDSGREERRARVREVMAELGLGDRAQLPVAKLSGGQRKRTKVALELLTRPSLLFLDEPTSGLDPGYEKAVMRLLRELADGGRIVVVATHSMQSLDVCDRVLFLRSTTSAPTTTRTCSTPLSIVTPPAGGSASGAIRLTTGTCRRR